MITDVTSKVASSIKSAIEKNNLIEKHGHVVVGLSGGPDSMCLFHALYGLKEEYNIGISVVHLNHKFRPGAAEEDQDFVEKLCKEYDVYCHSKTVDVNEAATKRGETPEEAGRTERYIAFDEEANRVADTGIPKDIISIAVAHNLNDQVETVLMRIMRGTGPDGLAGIPFKRDSQAGFPIIRPLLEVERADIEEYCDVNNLKPRIDHTNSQSDYGRNKIRLELIPKLKSDYNYNVEDAIIRLSSASSMDRNYFERLVNAILKNNGAYDTDDEGNIVNIKLGVENIKDAHPAIARRLIVKILKDIGLTQGIEASHIEASENAAIQNKTGTVIEFPEGYRMSISYDTAEFYRKSDGFISDTSSNKPVAINMKDIEKKQSISLPAGNLNISVGKYEPKKEDSNTIFMDLNKFTEQNDELTVRYRHPGDRIKLKGMDGTKKVQDLFVDKKIQQEKRDSIPILVSGEEIIWIIGVRRSDKYVPDESTKECLLLEWEANN